MRKIVSGFVTVRRSIQKSSVFVVRPPDLLFENTLEFFRRRRDRGDAGDFGAGIREVAMGFDCVDEPCQAAGERLRFKPYFVE